MEVDGALEQFVLLAKSARGDAAKHLIEQAIMSPGVYVFAELLNCRNIADLAQSTETRPHFDLLQLFAYGTYEQFIDERHKLPPLNDAMQLKLRQLTIASLAANCRRIGYATLLAQLHLNGNVRQLEDLIIDAIYKGIIDGKLDPRNQLLEIESWRSRDVAVGDTQAMTDVLANWSLKCETLLVGLEHEIERANSMKEEAIKRQTYIDNEVNNLKKTLRMSATPELDEPSEVSSSRAPPDDRKKETKRLKSAGLRGSSGRRVIGGGN